MTKKVGEAHNTDSSVTDYSKMKVEVCSGRLSISRQLSCSDQEVLHLPPGSPPMAFQICDKPHLCRIDKLLCSISVLILQQCVQLSARRTLIIGNG